MIIKQCHFKGIDENGNINCLPLFISTGMEKTAAVSEMRSKLHPRVRDFIGAVRPTAGGIYVLVNAMGAGEYWGSNVNGDLFPEKSLLHAPPNWDKMSQEEQREIAKTWGYGYPTFMNAHAFRHHVNKDSSRSFGTVELAVYNMKMHRVELVIYLDRALCKKFDAYDLIEQIEAGGFPDVSMGTKVPYDICTICEHRSKTRADYCDHTLTMMNKILPDGRKVAVRNDYPKFFDISFVFIGADKTAKVMAKLAHKGNQVCMGDVCTMSKTASVFESMKDTLMGDKTSKKELKTQRALEAKRDMQECVPERNYDAPMDTTVTKTAWKHRVTGSFFGGSAGALASLVGSKSVKADNESSKKEAIKDSVTGALLGAIFPGLSKKAEDEDQAEAAYWEFDTDRSKLTGLSERDAFKKQINKVLDKVANDPIKVRYEVQGVPVWIEWKRGETRLYKDKKTGEIKYKRFMKADYGYIPNTKDADGEEIDVYVGPDLKAPTAYVIKQLKKSDGSFDENKVMIGYASQKAAKDAYNYHMGGTVEFFGGINGVKVTALQALFGENGNGKEKEKKAHTCECDGACDPCGGSTEKVAATIFGISPEKYASHRKLSEILKDIPAGPFTKETLPRLERTERDIPNEVLNLMGGLPLGASMSTPGMLGMILKPREFQRVLLVRMGERDLADELDNKNMTFKHSKDVDSSIPVGSEHVNPELKELFVIMGLARSRSAAAPVLRSRAAVSANQGSAAPATSTTSNEPVMKKIAAAYNGYRRSLVKKATSIKQFLTTDPQLFSDLFGDSMVEAFAGGIDKVAEASVLSPDSLAYLVGAYTDRDFHLSSKEVVASLAQLGAVKEMV
jgi:hypothetical protein